MPSSLTIGGITFDEEEGQLCPAPADTPPSVRAALLEALETQPEVVIYSGTSETRVIRFASAESFGWVSNAQKLALMQLYLSRQSFSVSTDLLGVREQPVTFSGCYFDPGNPPVFASHPVPDGRYHYDLAIRMPLPGA